MSNQQQHHRHPHHHHASESMKSEDVQSRASVEDSSIQLRAYQIYQENGGPALDNWLEAERTLKNEH